MGNESTDILVVMVTAPNQEEAARIAEQVVLARQAACASVIPAIDSIYWWEGKLVKERETMVLMKTTAEKFLSLQDMIKEIHPYDIPEIIALPVKQGFTQYLEWVRRETS